MARSIWLDDPKNFEQLRQNFTTSLAVVGPTMNLPDMSEKLCELRSELDRLRSELARFACDCDHRCEEQPRQLASDGGCRRFKARQYSTHNTSEAE